MKTAFIIILVLLSVLVIYKTMELVGYWKRYNNWTANKLYTRPESYYKSVGMLRGIKENPNMLYEFYLKEIAHGNISIYCDITNKVELDVILKEVFPTDYHPSLWWGEYYSADIQYIGNWEISSKPLTKHIIKLSDLIEIRCQS